jgi:F-type H+-transporting ATPase subunit a
MFSGMVNSLFTFAATSGPNVDIAPGTVFSIGPINITNTILYGWICAAALIVTMIVIARRMTVRPKGGFTQIIEFLVEFVRNMVEDAFEDKKKAQKYIPYFAAVFATFLVMNLLGLLPFTRDAFHSGGTPLLKPMTADLNLTFAAAVVTMAYVYSSSVREAGSFGKYMRHFFVGSPKNPMFLLIGILEMISDASRVISLSLRLFLNVAIGELIIAVFGYLGHYIAPLSAAPFWLLDAFDLILQAYIFVILSVMYLAIAVNHAGETGEEYLQEEGLITEGKDDKMEAKPEGTAA